MGAGVVGEQGRPRPAGSEASQEPLSGGPGAQAPGCARVGTTPLQFRGRKPPAHVPGPQPADQERDLAHRKLHRRRSVGERNPIAAGRGRGRAAREGPEVSPPLFRPAAYREVLAPSFAVGLCASSRAPRDPRWRVAEPDGECGVGPEPGGGLPFLRAAPRARR